MRTLWAGNDLADRADAQAAAAELLEAWVPFLDAGGARPVLGATGASFDVAAEALEGVARPLFAAAPLAAGGYDWPHWDLVRRALVEGTDPDHPHWWGAATDQDQRIVEMAAVGLALALVPQHLWEPLGDAQRDRLAAWLRGVDTAEPHQSNWQLFRVMAQLGLRAVGEPCDEAAGRRSLEAIDSHLEQGGWYRDGDVSSTVDHYIPWAYHAYGLLYAWLAGERDPARAAAFRRRAVDIADDVAVWFDPDGGTLPLGRSLTYRFAAATFWGALAVGDCEVLPWDQVRGLWARHLRWWKGKPVLDADGLLTLGWTYPNLSMVEGYSSPASPWWACKAFLPLALGEEHPFWSADEAPMASRRDARAMPTARLVVSGDEHQAQAVVGGRGFWFMRQGPAKYGRFAYSSVFGPVLDGDDPLQPASDSMLRLTLPDGRVGWRTEVVDSGVDGEEVWSLWRPLPGVEVRTVLTSACPAHARVHHVTSDQPLIATEAGFAVGWHGGDPARPPAERTEADGLAAVRTEHGSSRIATVDVDGGEPVARRGRVIAPAPNTSITWPRALLPVLDAVVPAGDSVLACEVVATPV